MSEPSERGELFIVRRFDAGARQSHGLSVTRCAANEEQVSAPLAFTACRAIGFLTICSEPRTQPRGE